MAKRHTPESKAAAVARVLAGESREQVARDMEVGATTVRRWVNAAERRETVDEKKVAEKAEDIAARIEQLQEQVRDELLAKIRDLIPSAKSLRDAAWAYGVITDKSLLSRGKPTGIWDHRTSDPLDAEIDQLLKEEAAKRNGHSAAG